jgi:hypothetical protein
MHNFGNPNIFFHYWDSPLNQYTGSREQRAGVQSRNTRDWGRQTDKYKHTIPRARVQVWQVLGRGKVKVNPEPDKPENA